MKVAIGLTLSIILSALTAMGGTTGIIKGLVRASLKGFKSYGQIRFPDLEFGQVYMVIGIECGRPS